MAGRNINNLRYADDTTVMAESKEGPLGESERGERKTLDMIKKIADEKYNDTFWKEFGTNIKLGVIEDHSNRTRLAKLLRFQSSHHPSDMTSLDQYVERMKEKQDKIYFMAGASRKDVVEASAHLQDLELWAAAAL